MKCLQSAPSVKMCNSIVIGRFPPGNGEMHTLSQSDLRNRQEPYRARRIMCSNQAVVKGARSSLERYGEDCTSLTELAFSAKTF